MLDACPDTLIGKRDRALLAFGPSSTCAHRQVIE
jgi:hypothetical protein